jgi:uncharacterized metal-binding protein/predicted Fe-Mo cluster-binding NifX family protein
MLYGIPLFGKRVAPRCTIADELFLVNVRRNKIAATEKIEMDGKNWQEIMKILSTYSIDILVCGGINNMEKNIARSNGINVIDNVACSEDELIEAIETNKLRPGFGFLSDDDPDLNPEDFINETELSDVYVNCLYCSSKECMKGQKCPYIKNIELPECNRNEEQMLNAAIDISFEDERKLCRMSEVVYYCLEMKYRRIGIAYCTELSEATEILVSVLKRFFDVIPVCCMISGKNRDNGKQSCNPLGQARILNIMKTDFNIIVGLCLGADSIFMKESKAPVTTLFVKDKSLANNPIGALYSDYYLREVSKSTI